MQCIAIVGRFEQCKNGRRTTLKAIARKNGYSEAAYYRPAGDAWGLCTGLPPGCEVDLCGHATLAVAYVLSRCKVGGDGE
ncbi:MAG: PhzF family phenazine biosynthesis protein [Parahaliea sp.]